MIKIIKYNVNWSNDTLGMNENTKFNLSKTKAVKLAKELCKTHIFVFVSFAVVSDNYFNKGYLNANGDHEITGKNWSINGLK